jgi:hypothetical protein
MSEYEPWEMKLAWQEIWQLRCCPPDEVLRGSPAEPELQRHLETCPFCPDRLEEPTAGMDMTRAGQLAPCDRPAARAEPARDRPSPPSGLEDPNSKPPPEPGQIRSVRRALGGWGPKNRYTNPPLVLVVSLPGEPPEAVRVAQVHHMAPLSGPGDVEVAEGLFAESWNTYALRREDLDDVWEKVPGPSLQAVMESIEGGSPLAGGAEPPWLDTFRRLEIEVGAFFALQAVSGMMEGWDESPSARILSRFPEVSDLADHLRKRKPGAVLPRAPMDVLASLALARFPDHELPLAAAGSENRIVLNRAGWSDEGLELTPVGAELTLWKSGPDGLTLGGVLDEGAPAGSELRAWWDRPGEAPVPASETSFNPAEGFFRASFDGLSGEMAREGRPVLLLCCPAGRNDPC